MPLLNIKNKVHQLKKQQHMLFRVWQYILLRSLHDTETEEKKIVYCCKILLAINHYVRATVMLEVCDA